MRFTSHLFTLFILCAALPVRADPLAPAGASLGVGFCGDHLATDERFVYFIGAPQGEPWRIVRVPKDGGARETIAEGCNYGPFVVDANALYCLAPDGEGHIPESPSPQHVLRIDPRTHRRRVLATIGAEAFLFDAGPDLLAQSVFPPSVGLSGARPQPLPPRLIDKQSGATRPIPTMPKSAVRVSVTLGADGGRRVRDGDEVFASTASGFITRQSPGGKAERVVGPVRRPMFDGAKWRLNLDHPRFGVDASSLYVFVGKPNDRCELLSIPRPPRH